MMNDGKQQSTFLFFTITRNTPENRHEQVFHDL